MIKKNCDLFAESIFSRMTQWFGGNPGEFYVVYPPLEQAEEIRNHPELFDPSKWEKEGKYSWFHEANDVADEINTAAGKVVAVVIEHIKE